MMMIMNNSILILFMLATAKGGFFARRNVTRRLFYNALKEKNTDIETINLNSNAVFEETDELQEKLHELIDAVDFKIEANADKNKNEGHKSDRISHSDKKAQLQPENLGIGEAFNEGERMEGEQNRIQTVGPLRLPDDLRGPQALRLVQSNDLKSSFKKRPRSDRRRKKMKKGTALDEKESTMSKKTVSKTKATIVQQPNKNIQEENYNPSSTRKPMRSTFFDWQKPVGQWHLPQGQFQPISGTLQHLALAERETENKGMKLMVYSGQLDRKIVN